MSLTWSSLVHTLCHISQRWIVQLSGTSDGASPAPLRLHYIYSAMTDYQRAPGDKCSYCLQVSAADPPPGWHERTHARTIRSRAHTNRRCERERVCVCVRERVREREAHGRS